MDHACNSTAPCALLAPSKVQARAHDKHFASLYAELRRVARSEARKHGSVAQLSPTTLVHEAYLRIADRDSLAFADQGHFLAYAARAMRGLVIDHLRARGAIKRGGEFTITSLDTQTAEDLPDPAVLDHISTVLDDLAELDGDLAHLVDLRFFCGFTMAEIAAQRGVSERTVQRQWEKARALLFRALKAA